MASVSVSKKPSGKVSSLSAPKRNNATQTFTSSWGIPSSHTKDSNNARATGIEVQWQLETAHDGKPWISRTGGTSWKSDTLQLNSSWKFSNGKKYTRKMFYPYRNNRLYSIICWVRETNNKGKGAWVKSVRKLEFPDAPKISWPEMSESEGSAGNVSCDVTWEKDPGGYREADQCEFWVYVTDTSDGSKNKLVQNETRSGEKFTITYDAKNRMKIDYDGYIRILFRAKAYGLRGNSDKFERQFVVSYPREATINNVVVSGISKDREDGIETTNKVTAHINLRSGGEHPVTGCVLEKLVGTNAQTYDEASAAYGWTETGAKDDGQCTALAVAAEELLEGTAPGNSVWLRVKSWNQNKSIFYRYSRPWRVTQLETPAAGETSNIHILSLVPGADGESAVVQMAWDDGTVPTGTIAGTELTWSDDEYAWQSTAMPSAYEFTLDEGPITHEGTTYPGSAKIYIRNLKQGTVYYVRARRSYETDAGTTYSSYCPIETMMPVTAPSNVTMVTPAFIPRGDSLPISWGFDSTGAQSAWHLLKGTITSTVDDSVTPPVITESFEETEMIASGEDSLASYVVDADRLAGLLMKFDSSGNPILDPDTGDYTYDDSISLAVEVSTGGDFYRSKAYTVQMADVPQLEIDLAGTLTAQPVSFDATCNTPCDLAVVVTSQGAQGEFPGGVRTQVAGDTMYAETFTPIWAMEDDAYTTTIELPAELDFWDNASYTVHVRAINTQTGLNSELQEAEFAVAWAHQAPEPSDAITVAPSDVTDEEGYRTRKVEIQLAAPVDALETDLYDIYRVTPDGAYLVAQGQVQDALITDFYAPYGDGVHIYRVVCRTVDGDVNWLDYEYEFAGKELRIDFGGQYIELPWNITIGDAYTKDFEARAHLGSDTPEGYWNENITRNASFSTDVLRIQEREKITTLRSLAKFNEPVFVRTPNGSAYQANIDVSGIDEAYNGAFIGVALDGQEVGLSEDYWAQVPAVVAPEDGE